MIPVTITSPPIDLIFYKIKNVIKEGRKKKQQAGLSKACNHIDLQNRIIAQCCFVLENIAFVLDRSNKKLLAKNNLAGHVFIAISIKHLFYQLIRFGSLTI